jgi:hypothetical protein
MPTSYMEPNDIYTNAVKRPEPLNLLYRLHNEFCVLCEGRDELH